ncbi:hypothetical protein ACFQU7_20785 [Pseudoroseomonas wenyumeiae]
MGEAPPAIFGWTFLLYAAIGGLTQIIGTNLLIMSFGPRGFAVGTAYSKTEAVQGAVLALVLLGERISFCPPSASCWACWACCISRWRGGT